MSINLNFDFTKRRQQRQTDEFKDQFLERLKAAGADEITLKTLSTVKAETPSDLMTTIKSVQDIVANTEFGIQRQIKQKAQEATATEVAKREVGLSYKPQEAKADLDAKLNEVKALDEAEFGTQAKRFERSGDLRGEFVKSAGDFESVRDSFARIQAAGTSPTPAGDLALIFNYMKMLDPKSVVRESEFRTVEEAASFANRVYGLGLKVGAGNKLVPEQRKDVLQRSKDLFQSQAGIHKKRVSEFTRLSQRAGVDPADVILDLTLPDSGGADGQSANTPPSVDELFG